MSFKRPDPIRLLKLAVLAGVVLYVVWNFPELGWLGGS